MKYTTRVQTIPDGDPIAGARVTITRQDDGITAATGLTDAEGWVTLTANGAPGNVWIDTFRGSDRFRDDSRSQRPYGQFSPAEWAETAQQLCGDGVVPYGASFAATAGTGALTLGTGAALLNGVLGVWSTSTVLPVSSGARACAVAYSGTGRLQLVDVAQADLTSNHLTLYTYNVSGGTITGLSAAWTPVLEGIMSKRATVQSVVRAATGDTSNSSGEASGNEITFTLRSGVTYDIEASASVISRGRAGAIAIEIDGNLSSYAANGGDITTTITNSHTRSKTGGSCLIRLFERSDTSLTEWVSDLTFGSAGSGTTNFNNPSQIARDSSGNIYIADTANNRLKKHQADGTYVTSLTDLTGIRGVCVDGSNNVYISALSGTTLTLKKYNSSLTQQWSTTVVCNLTSGCHLFTDNTNLYVIGADFGVYTMYRRLCSTGASAGSSYGYTVGSEAFQLNAPQGVAYDGTSIYIVDQANKRIQKAAASNPAAITSTWGSSGTGDGQFTTPVGIAVNPVSGNILVTDTGRDDIQEFTNTGTFVGKYASLGSGSGHVSDPTGIVVAASGTSFYVADQGNDRVQRFTETASSFSYDSALLFARAIPRK